MYRIIFVLVVLIFTACGRSGNDHGHDHESEQGHLHNEQNMHEPEHEQNTAEDHELTHQEEQGHAHSDDHEAVHEHASEHDHQAEENDHGHLHENNEAEHDAHEHSGDPDDTDTHSDEPQAHSHDHASSGEGTDEHAHDAEISGETMPNQVRFSVGHQDEDAIRIHKITASPFSSVIHASGKIMPVPGEEIYVAAPGNGTLRYLNKKLVQGSAVTKGQPLFIIRSEFIDDDNFELRFHELRNALEKSRSEFNRHKKLYKSEVISEKKMQETRTIYMNDSLRFYNLADKASSNGLKITAPITGYIHALNFSEGQYVESGQQIITVSSNKRLLLRADVPMQLYLQAREVVTTTFRTAYSDRIYNIENLDGTLLSIGSTVLENDHFIPVHFEVLNDGTLLEGAYLEFYLKTGKKENTLLVPAGSLIEEQGNYYVYIRTAPEMYEKRRIMTGETDGEYIAVVNGVTEGEQVVSKGTMLLKAASIVTSQGGDGHNH